MFSGDANADGSININDKSIWTNQAGEQGYISSDMNLDSQVNNPDKNEKWLSNYGEETQVPE